MRRQLVIGTLVMGILMTGMAGAVHAGWFSLWAFDCHFKGNEVDLVSLAVWDDSIKTRDPLRRNLDVRRAPTWVFVVTKEELAEMKVTGRGERRNGFLGLNSTCEVVSSKTGQKLSFDEALVVFEDILAKQDTAAKAGEVVRRNTIRRALVERP
jgi:hypothetical protein